MQLLAQAPAPAHAGQQQAAGVEAEAGAEELLPLRQARRQELDDSHSAALGVQVVAVEAARRPSVLREAKQVTPGLTGVYSSSGSSAATGGGCIAGARGGGGTPPRKDGAGGGVGCDPSAAFARASSSSCCFFAIACRSLQVSFFAPRRARRVRLGVSSIKHQCNRAYHQQATAWELRLLPELGPP